MNLWPFDRVSMTSWDVQHWETWATQSDKWDDRHTQSILKHRLVTLFTVTLTDMNQLWHCRPSVAFKRSVDKRIISHLFHSNIFTCHANISLLQRKISSLTSMFFHSEWKGNLKRGVTIFDKAYVEILLIWEHRMEQVSSFYQIRICTITSYLT